MARDLKKKQRKLLKQKSKQKAEKKALARQASLGKRGEFEVAARYPVLHCCEFIDSRDVGMTQVLLSRRMGGGNVAYALFLLDTYCLGVKDVNADISPEGAYNANIYDGLCARYERIRLSPADARKLVEGAVQYAANLRLAPHPDYRRSQPIFGDINPDESTTTFEYGRNGKPCYINGPHDSPEKIRRIMASLRENCGEGNFDFIFVGGGGFFDDFGDALEAVADPRLEDDGFR